MSESKHTPGPWSPENVMGDRQTDIVLDYHIQGREFPILVASVYCDDDDDNPPAAKPISSREAEANARLIAAAPDLLDACRVFANLSEYRSLVEDMALRLRAHERSSFVAAFADAAAAVRKAEGGQP